MNLSCEKWRARATADLSPILQTIQNCLFFYKALWSLHSSPEFVRAWTPLAEMSISYEDTRQGVGKQYPTPSAELCKPGTLSHTHTHTHPCPGGHPHASRTRGLHESWQSLPGNLPSPLTDLTSCLWHPGLLLGWACLRLTRLEMNHKPFLRQSHS